MAEIERPFDVIVTAVGTGGTLAGLSSGLGPGQRAIGVCALRGAVSLDAEVAELQRAALGHRLDNWAIDHRFHHGGFARRGPELNALRKECEARH